MQAEVHEQKPAPSVDVVAPCGDCSVPCTPCAPENVPEPEPEKVPEVPEVPQEIEDKPRVSFAADQDPQSSIDRQETPVAPTRTSESS